MEQQTELPQSITSLLRTLDTTDDENIGFILAATFNLYCEALRRIHGRVLLGPSDIRAILNMAHTMVANPPVLERAQAPTRESRELTKVEEEQLLNAAVEPKLRRV